MNNEKFSKEKILEDVIKIIKDVTSGFDTDYSNDLQPGSRIAADLGFESIDVVEMIVAIEEHYQRRDLPFQKLIMREGKYQDFKIAEIADFLYNYLTAQEKSSE